MYAVFVAYLPLIAMGRSLMSERVAFDLKTPMKIWNCTLSILSFIGFTVNLGYLQEVTFETSYTQTAIAKEGTYGMILMMFSLSKFVELFDTVFLVLRKKHVGFLHWFHHLTVLIYGWLCVQNPIGTGYWFGQTNMLVHAVMYAYFAFASELRGVAWFNPMWITVLQIVQMVWGLLISTLYLLHPDCVYDHLTLVHSAYSITMYASYLYLFCKFFHSKNHFQTPVNWSMCAYLLAMHVLGVQGALRCESWWVTAEVIVLYQVCGRTSAMSCKDSGRGFFYSHMGWLMLDKPKNAEDQIQYKLWDQAWCFVVSGLYGIWRLGSFWDGFLIFGALRWLLCFHATDKSLAEILLKSFVATGED